MDHKIRVMLVDDEYLAIEDLKTLIDWESAGFEICSSASSGRQALRIFREKPVDLVITDISMPGMDGISLIEQLKSLKSDLLFLLLTAYAEVDYMKKAFRLGVQDYLIKDETDIETIKKDVVLVYSQNYSRDFNATNFPVLIGELMDQCSQMSFLFDCVEYEEANNLGLAFGKFLSVLYNADDKMVIPAKAAYLKAIDNFVTAHIEEISSCLFISNS